MQGMVNHGCCPTNINIVWHISNIIQTVVLPTVLEKERGKREVQEEALGGQNIHQQPDPQQDPFLHICQSIVGGLNAEEMFLLFS